MEDIRIIQHGAMFEVVQDDKTSGELTFDEALGLLASLMMPERRPCLNWMKTNETRNKIREDFKKSAEDFKFEI